MYHDAFLCVLFITCCHLHIDSCQYFLLLALKCVLVSWIRHRLFCSSCAVWSWEGAHYNWKAPQTYVHVHQGQVRSTRFKALLNLYNMAAAHILIQQEQLWWETGETVDNNINVWFIVYSLLLQGVCYHFIPLYFILEWILMFSLANRMD